MLQPQLSDKKIMAIDDELDVLRLIQLALQRYGHTVDTFSEPLSALCHFQKNHQDYNLLLVDVRMPGMSGIEFAKHAKSAYPEVKVLLMTAFEINRHDLEKNLPFVKIDDLLKKPFMLSKICEIIDKHVTVKENIEQQ